MLHTTSVNNLSSNQILCCKQSQMTNCELPLTSKALCQDVVLWRLNVALWKTAAKCYQCHFLEECSKKSMFIRVLWKVKNYLSFFSDQNLCKVCGSPWTCTDGKFEHSFSPLLRQTRLCLAFTQDEPLRFPCQYPSTLSPLFGHLTINAFSCTPVKNQHAILHYPFQVFPAGREAWPLLANVHHTWAQRAECTAARCCTRLHGPHREGLQNLAVLSTLNLTPPPERAKSRRNNYKLSFRGLVRPLLAC